MTTITLLQKLGPGAGTIDEIASERVPGCKIRWATDSGSVIQRAAGTDVIVTVNEPVGREAIEAIGPRMVAISFTGFDHVDLDAARDRGVAVTNVPSYATDSVAELTVCAIISMMRKVVECDVAVKGGRWRDGLIGSELAHKTVGIVGTGAIGLAVVRRLAAFGCRLLGWSRSESPEFGKLGGRHVELGELLSLSDVVTLHVPLCEQTRGLIGADELRLMQPHALLVNTARGPVVDTVALASALAAGTIARAAVDVYDVEPISRDNPLLRAPGTLLLPHVAFATSEALQRKAEITFDCIRAFLDGKKLNRID